MLIGKLYDLIIHYNMLDKYYVGHCPVPDIQDVLAVGSTLVFR
jgi:predicted RNase H-like HicB family nuclease